MRDTTPGRWFSRVVLLGVVANLALAVPTLVAPAAMLALAGLPEAVPLVWIRFAAWLLVLLSGFYVPAALDPDRFRAVAWLAVLARLAGVLFFSMMPAPYRTFGLFDLAFLVPELLLLLAGQRAAASAAAPASGVRA